MAYALTSLALTVVYVVLALVNTEAAAEVGIFYIASVLILWAAQRIAHRDDGRA